MKKFLLFAVGVVIMLTISLQPSQAQVYGEFDTIRVITGVQYQELTGDITIAAEQFTFPPSGRVDRDDGYYQLPLTFPFEFNGEVFNRIWICVNGFITFTPPPFIPAKDSRGLFTQANSFPINVIAPFWGDHFYRIAADNRNESGEEMKFPEHNEYKPSKISYKFTDDGLVIQWKDLNINKDPDRGFLTSSVANFQLKIYKSNDPLSAQGNIEFIYGQVHGNQRTHENEVIVKGASIGVKGEFSDYLNALWFWYNGAQNEGTQSPLWGNNPIYNVDVVRGSTTLTTEWTPDRKSVV
mgnify:FL=1